MEEMCTVSEQKESRELPITYETIVSKPQLLPADITDDQTSFTQQTHETSDITATTQQEYPPAPAPVPITPVWHEPVQMPKAAQKEQQKRMEEKFMKKVIERKESKDVPDTSEASTNDTLRPFIPPVLQTQQPAVQSFSNSCQQEFKKRTITKETTAPAEIPAIETFEQQTKEDVKESEQGDRKQDIIHESHAEIIKPQLAPLESSEQQNIYTQDIRKTTTTITTSQAPTILPHKVQPIWVEPVETPKATQTPQQKRMEEKFMKKVIEHQESKDMTDISETQPVPGHDDHRSIHQPPQSEEISQTHTSKRQSWHETRQTVESTPQSLSVTGSMHVPTPKALPPKPETAPTKDKKLTRPVRERERKTSYHDTSMSDFSDSETSIKIKEIESKPLQMDTYESYTNKFFVGPKVQEPPIYHKIQIEGQDDKKKDNIYETIIPLPAQFKPAPETQPVPTAAEKTTASTIIENVIKHVASPATVPKSAPKETHQISAASEIHAEAIASERPVVVPGPVPEPVRFTPTQFVPAQPTLAAAQPAEPATEPPLTAVKHVDSPKPTRKHVPKATPAVTYPFEDGDVPPVPCSAPKTEQQPIIPNSSIAVGAKPQKITSSKHAPTEIPAKLRRTPSVPQKQHTETVPVQKKMKKEEKLMRKYDDIVKRTKQTTREEEKRVFSPSPAPVERTDISGSKITEFSKSKQFSNRTERIQMPEAPKLTPKPAPTQTVGGVKSTLEKLQKQTKSEEITGHAEPISLPTAESKQQTQISQKFESTMTAQYSSAWQTPAPAAVPGPAAKPTSVPACAPHKHLTTRHATDESRKHEVIAKISSHQRDEARPVAVRPVPEPRGPRQRSTKRIEQTESSRRVSEQAVKSSDTVKPAPRPVQPPVPPPRTDSSERRETARQFSERKTISDSYQTPPAAPRPMEVLSQSKRTPHGMPEPYVDRQETFSSSRSDEKTATGHRQSESAEKKSHEVMHSVTNLPGSSTTRTMQQSSYQTMSQSFETSEQSFPAFPAPKAIEFPPLLTPEPFSEPQSSLDQSSSWQDMADMSSSLDEQIVQQYHQEPQTTPVSVQGWRTSEEKKQTEQTSRSYRHNEQIIPIEMPPLLVTRKAVPKHSNISHQSKEERHEMKLDAWQDITPKSAPSTPGASCTTVDSASRFEKRQTGSRQTVDGRERIIPITPETPYSRPTQPFLRTPEKEQHTMISQGINRFETTTQQMFVAPRETVLPVQLTSQNLQKHTQNLSGATTDTFSQKPIASQQQQRQCQQKWLDEQIQQSRLSQTSLTGPSVAPTNQQKSDSLSHQSKFEKSMTSSGHEQVIPVTVTTAFAPRAIEKQSDVVSRSVLDSSMKTSASPFSASPYVDKQETCSHSKNQESIGNVTKDTESSERSIYSVQRSGPQTIHGPTPGSSVTQSSSEVRYDMSQSHTEQTSGRWPQAPVSQPYAALPPTTSEKKHSVFETKSANTGTHWGSQSVVGSQPVTSGSERTNQPGSSKSMTESSRKDVSKTDQATRWGSGRGPVSLGLAPSPKSESSFVKKHTKDGKNEHYQSLGYTSGGDVEHIEEANHSIHREKENMNAKKVDNKTEVFETEEMRPDGRYRIQKTVETKTEEELTQNKHTETTTQTLPAIGR